MRFLQLMDENKDEHAGSSLLKYMRFCKGIPTVCPHNKLYLQPSLVILQEINLTITIKGLL